MDNHSQLMTTFPLFKGFAENGTKRLLDAGEITQPAPGEVLFKEGDTAEFVLLVLTGKLEEKIWCSPKQGRAQYWASWLSCAAFRARLQCGQRKRRLR